MADQCVNAGGRKQSTTSIVLPATGGRVRAGSRGATRSQLREQEPSHYGELPATAREGASARGQRGEPEESKGGARTASAPGTKSRSMGRGACNRDTRRGKGSLSCCQQVRSTLSRTSWVCAPAQVRFPPHTLRVTTMGRRASSA